MDNIGDIELNNNQNNPKKLFSGFLSNLNSITSTIFTIIPSVFAWYVSKDFKIMFIVLISCLSFAIIVTIKNNSKSNENLIKLMKLELDNYNIQINEMTENLISKDNRIKSLQLELDSTISNRDTILERFDEYKNYKDAYNSAKHGMFVLSNMQNNKSIKNSVEVLFKGIEKELHERNEDIERCI